MIRYFFLMAFSLSLLCPSMLFSQIKPGIVVVRPKEIDHVLNNPGIGFTTFQRFNGDTLNAGDGWTEGFPIDYQPFTGGLTNKSHPQTTIAYWRVYWKYIEPQKGKYRWDLIDQALARAEERGQTLLLRFAPYGDLESKEDIIHSKKDVPLWFREMVGKNTNWKYNNPVNKWLVNPEDSRYVEYFGGFISELGKRYDGHPALEGVDLSIVGAWGEGAGSELLTQKTREALIDAYTDNFKVTPLIALLMDEKTNKYANSKANVGWRVDCIGDLGIWAKEQNGFTHMYDSYPQIIIQYGTSDNWKTAPLSMEICTTFLSSRDEQGYSKEDVKYIFDQTLKWHISSFNAKSSPVPPEWEPLVNDWLKKMGYRFVLRKFAYPETVKRNARLPFESWWENKGVAPCYKKWPLAIKLKSEKDSVIFLTDADIRHWLPGDNLYDNSVFIPVNFTPGYYDLQLALVDPSTRKPRILLAIEGKNKDGWYDLGKIKIE